MFSLLLWMLVSGVGGKSNQLRATVHYRLIVGLVRNIAFVLFDFDFDCCFLSFFCLNKIVSRSNSFRHQTILKVAMLVEQLGFNLWR